MRRPIPPSGLFGKIATLVIGGILLILGFMFSLVLLTIAALIGLTAWAYFWWRTRGLRQAMRKHGLRGQIIGGEVIDGEVIVVDDPDAEGLPALPDEQEKR